MRISLPWALLAPWLLLACSKEPPKALLARSDPAIERHLQAQPDAHGGIARWAHQFMLAEEAVSRLAAQGYECPPAAADAKERVCEKWEKSFASRFLGKVRADRVVIVLRHPGPRVARIEGMVAEDSPQGPVYSARVSAPGLSFADIHAMADFVLDAHRAWHARQYCFPAALPPGCDEEYQARAASGWRHWDGRTPVAIGTAEESAASLIAAGFSCRSTAALSDRKRAGELVLEDERLWLDCTAEALDGQPQRVRLGVNPLTRLEEALRVSAGTRTLEIPVARAPRPS